MNALPQPDFVAQFKWAVIRLATYVESSTAQPQLLFGSVSLLVNDRPPPKSSEVDTFNIANGRHGRVLSWRTVLTAAEAIKWYLSGTSNRMRIPISYDPQEIHTAHDADEFTVSNFFDNPTWPILGFPSGSDSLFSSGGPGDPVPFVGSGSEPARIHRRFGNSTGFEAVIRNVDAIRFLKRRLHVDFGDYSEYLGSLVLIVPNPIVRSIRYHIVPINEEGSENLVFRLIPRAGQTVEGLSLTVLEWRANLMSRFETVTVPKDGLLVLPRQLPVHKSGYVLTDIEHGVLAYQAPVTFIRYLNASMGILGRRVRIESPKTDSPHSEIAPYEVSEISAEYPITRESAPLRSGLSHVFEAEQRRQRRAQARRYDQTWIDNGQRHEALQFIRSRIARARSHVLVADPYFGAQQILQFLHAVPNIDVELTILTSKLAFGGGNYTEEDCPTQIDEGLFPGLSEKSRAEQSRLGRFSHHMATFKKRGIENASALVLVGKKLPLHDRFLVIDDTVWFLGNSLNALGQRASLILQVPDGEPILDRLKEMLKRAISFDKYFEQRRNASSRQQRGA